MMKAKLYIPLLFLFTLLACEKEQLEEEKTGSNTPIEQTSELPEGYFEVRFTSENRLPGITKAVSGEDGRVQHVRYIVYKTTGEYVKEKVIHYAPGDVATWPMNMIRDTLPIGAYKAVFLGNVEPDLFAGVDIPATDVLTNYKTSYSDARIVLPNSAFTDNSEYYWDTVSFSNTSATASVLLQRIIGSASLHRNLVDAQAALDSLVQNIVRELGYKDLLTNTVSGLLPDLLENTLNDVPGLGLLLVGVTGGLDVIVNALVGGLVSPLVDALYEMLLQQLISQLGAVLTANTGQEGLLGALGALLNPWNATSVTDALVTINDFPRSVSFDLAVQDKFEGANHFQFEFTATSLYDEKDIPIKGFSGMYDIQEINILNQGLVGGVVVDGALDGLLLDGALVDITEPLNVDVAPNTRWKNNYSFLNLGLKDYTGSGEGLNLSVRLGDLALGENGLSGLLGGTLGNIPLLGPILNNLLGLIIEPLENIEVGIPPELIKLPLLSGTNLTLDGTWETTQQY